MECGCVQLGECWGRVLETLYWIKSYLLIVRWLGQGFWEGLGRPRCVLVGNICQLGKILQYFNNHYNHPRANLLNKGLGYVGADGAEACDPLWALESLAA